MKVILAVFTILLASCDASDKGKLLPHTEIVLKPGMSVTATNPNGTVTINADGQASRVFSGKGWEKKSRLIPRRTRWYGSLGLYDPASSFSKYGRLLVDEGLLFFETESEALRYLYVGSTHYKPVFTNSGLVVGYHIDQIPGGEATRSVKLWQIYINGKKPTRMKGADDTAITLKGGTIPDTAAPNEAPIGYEATLGKHEYQPASNSER